MEGTQPQSPEATTATAEPPSQLKLRHGKIFASELAFQHVFPPGCNGDATFDTIDLTDVSLQSVRKKSFTATNNSFMITYADSIDYKGERIWHCTPEHRGDTFSNICTATCCMLTTDRLRVVQMTKSRSWMATFGDDTKIRDEYDVLQMLLSSAELYIAENGIDSLARRTGTTNGIATNDTTASSTTPASSTAIATTTRGDLFLKRLKRKMQNVMSRRRRSSRLSRMSTDSSVAFVLRSVPDEEEDASLEFIE